MRRQSQGPALSSTAPGPAPLWLHQGERPPGPGSPQPGCGQRAPRVADSGFPRRNFKLFKPTLLSPLRKVTELVFYPIIRG